MVLLLTNLNQFFVRFWFLQIKSPPSGHGGKCFRERIQDAMEEAASVLSPLSINLIK